MQLNDYVTKFASMDINVAAVSYDSFEYNASFATEQGLNYPLLSDQDAATVRAFGILNADYEEGHPAYGVPLPGIFLIGADGTISLKRAMPRYQDRPNLDELLVALSTR